MRLSFVLIPLLACNITKPAPLPEMKRLAGVTLENVDIPAEGGSGDTGYWPTFLRDPAGGLHIAYCDASNGDAKIAHEKPGGWDLEVIDSKGAVGKYITGEWGPDGPEVVYLDQSKKTLRYAWKSKDGWKFQNLGSDNEDIGISGKFRIAPGGERLYTYYNTRNELLLAVGRKVEGVLVWETSKIAKAGAVHNIQTDLGFLDGGKIALSYPDWAVSRSTLYYATIPDLAQQKPGRESTLALQQIDDANVAGLKSQLIPRGGVFDVLFMAGHGGMLYLAAPSADGWKRTQLSTNIANLAAVPLEGGTLAVALEVGKVDGLGEGALHYGERSSTGTWAEWLIDDSRPVGQYLAVATLKAGGRVIIAYYDGAKKGLKVARIP